MTLDAVLDAVPLAGGFALLVAGLWAGSRRPRLAAGRAVLIASALAAVVLGTGTDGAAWLHTARGLAAGLLPAALLHVALTFPVDRLRGRRAALLGLYPSFLVLALVSELVAGDPTSGDAIQAVVLGGGFAGAAAIVVALALGITRPPGPLVSRRAALGLLGALGTALPTAAWQLRPEAMIGWPLADAVAPTAFLFPLAVGAALAAPGLCALDELLRRVLSGALLTSTVAATYVMTWIAIGVLDPDAVGLTPAPTEVALINLAIVFLVAPVRDAVRALVDRLLAPAAYDGEACLAALSRGLASARTVDTVVAHSREVLARSLRPSWTLVYLPDGGGRFRPAPGGASRRPVAVPTALMVPLERGEPVQIDDAAELRAALPPPWNALDTALLMPLRADGAIVGLLVLGARAPRRLYTAHDLSFLRTAAYQIALALLGSTVVDQLDALTRRQAELNTRLEAQVTERTAALEAKNAELNQSLEELRRAYRRLEENHAGLLRAERLATLGRLSAGLAHEINTPLSAVMNALKILGDLGREYAAAVDDPSVLPADHREIAKEILATTTAAAEWAQKAAAYIRGVKSHGREARPGAMQSFALGEVVDEARGLVTHRLRAAGCTIEFVEDPPGLVLSGDRGQLGQVLMNLITNAIDAYEERGIANGRIALHAAQSDGGIRLRVTDWAGGIPTAILPHIFEELYTTKGPGRGTGLGLWIARALVEQGFGGTLDVLTSGGSSCFVADFPASACVLPVAERRTLPRTVPPPVAVAAAS